jgi:hypothetical protein
MSPVRSRSPAPIFQPLKKICAEAAFAIVFNCDRKIGHARIPRGDRRWLIRVYLGRDQETNKRKNHNRTIHGSMREAQAYLTSRLRERDWGRDLEIALTAASSEPEIFRQPSSGT